LLINSIEKKEIDGLRVDHFQKSEN
jgi:hypothetical protein